MGPLPWEMVAGVSHSCPGLSPLSKGPTLEPRLYFFLFRFSRKQPGGEAYFLLPSESKQPLQ